MDLYAEQGFEKTTVAQIAVRAGLTERTYFRHFDDKREVLFDGVGMARDLLTSAVEDAPAPLVPEELSG
jgi:AcrR family transcriptional regulator